MAVAVVARYICGVGGNCHRAAEVDRLPPASSLGGECGCRQKLSRAGPERAYVSSGVTRAPVILEARNRSCFRRDKFHAEIDLVWIGVGKNGWRLSGSEQALGREGCYNRYIHSPGRSVLTVGGGIVEARGTLEALGGNERDSSCLGVVADSPTNRCAYPRNRKNIAVSVAVIRKELGTCNIEEHVLLGECDIVGRRRYVVHAPAGRNVQHVDPIVGPFRRVDWEAVRIAVREVTVSGTTAIACHAKRAIAVGFSKEALGAGIVSIAEIADYVGRAAGDSHRIGEDDRLPASHRFGRERGRGKQRTGAAPKRADMVAGIQEALVKLHSDDRAILGGYKFYTQVGAVGVTIRLHRRNFIAGE